MDLAVFGSGVDATDSTELLYAERQFLASLSTQIVIVRSDAHDSHALMQAALDSADQLGLRPHARVLLAKNTFLWPGPGTLSELMQVLDDGAPVAFAYDSTQPCPHLLPDYLTLRGLERYVSRLASQPNRPVLPGTPWPRLALATVAAIRGGCKVEGAVWAARAFAHDFSDYHQGRRDEVIPLIPATVRRVLDVGGGEGGFLTALKAHVGCETHLAEFSSAACAVAAERVDTVWPGDFVSARIDVKFDCVTFLDVLEHTAWPVQWLRRAGQLLEPGACVLASIPNVGHWSVVLDLLEGRWDYAPAGIHCLTHLRFFTRHGVEQLMADAGLKIERIETTRVGIPPWFDVSAMAGNIEIDMDSLSTVAFLVLARPVT